MILSTSYKNGFTRLTIPVWLSLAIWKARVEWKQSLQTVIQRRCTRTSSIPCKMLYTTILRDGEDCYSKPVEIPKSLLDLFYHHDCAFRGSLLGFFESLRWFSRCSGFQLLTKLSMISGIANSFPSDLEVAYATLIMKRIVRVDITINVRIWVRCVVSVFIPYAVCTTGQYNGYYQSTKQQKKLVNTEH